MTAQPASTLPALPDQDGRLIRVRQAVPGDRPALERMFARCSPRTRYQRFHAPVKAIPARYLGEAVSGSPFHYALIAWHQDETAAEFGEKLQSMSLNGDALERQAIGTGGVRG